MNPFKITDLYHDLLLIFDLQTDIGCTLITNVIQTILDFNEIESNGRCEDEQEMELAEYLTEFFNAVRPPEESRFTQLIKDYVETPYPPHITEKEYILSKEEDKSNYL